MSSISATAALAAHANGDAGAVDELVDHVYDELRRLARNYMRRERDDHTLTPTALVNEAYLRLIDGRQIDWRGKTHFFAVAANEMRRVLVEHARAASAQKRGAGRTRVSLSSRLVPASPPPLDVLAIDEALNLLRGRSERQSLVVTLRVFGGLQVREVALVLQVSERTVKQDWHVGRAFLARELRGRASGVAP